MIDFESVVVRLPVFKRGNDELPLLGERHETTALWCFRGLRKVVVGLPWPLAGVLSESVLVHARRTR
ncbi:MAG: hypothetical protein Kow0069_27060 [Promethearchaeota archaeon]